MHQRTGSGILQTSLATVDDGIAQQDDAAEAEPSVVVLSWPEEVFDLSVSVFGRSEKRAVRVDVGDIGVAELDMSSAPPMESKWKTKQWMELADENGQHAGASVQIQLRWSPVGRRPETAGERARTPTVAALAKEEMRERVRAQLREIYQVHRPDKLDTIDHLVEEWRDGDPDLEVARRRHGDVQDLLREVKKKYSIPQETFGYALERFAEEKWIEALAAFRLALHQVRAWSHRRSFSLISAHVFAEFRLPFRSRGTCVIPRTSRAVTTASGSATASKAMRSMSKFTSNPPPFDSWVCFDRLLLITGRSTASNTPQMRAWSTGARGTTAPRRCQS